MENKRLDHWLQILGMFGIMGSLVFVGLQVRQTDTIASLEIQEYAVQRHYNALSLMAEFADVWQRGCSGEELSATERTQFAKILTVYQQNNFAGWRRLQLSGYRDGASDYNIDVMAANIHRYPGFASAYDDLMKWQEFAKDSLGPASKEYRRLIAVRVKNLASLESNPTLSTEFCGHS